MNKYIYIEQLSGENGYKFIEKGESLNWFNLHRFDFNKMFVKSNQQNDQIFKIFKTIIKQNQNIIKQCNVTMQYIF